MSATKKPRCFVAMAFGYQDTDYIYDQWIRPSITQAGFVAIRVDKIIHNERIDTKIRNEIQKADLLIADLTYARPSVYWEAGYAERVIPVIYTCRKDHFSSASNKIDNSLKVHFDLANANIIIWSDKGNKTFGTNIAKRIRFVTKELRKQKEENIELANKRNSFSQKSLVERDKVISTVTIKTLLNAKYKRVKFGTDERDPQNQSRLLRPIYGNSNGLFWRIINETGILISAHNCFPKVFTDMFYPWQNPYMISSVTNNTTFTPELLPVSIRKQAKNKVRYNRQIKIFPILQSVTDRRIESIFTTWRNAGLNGWYFDPEHNFKKRKFSKEIVFISNIKSVDDFRSVTLELLNLIEKNNPYLNNSTN